MIKILISGYSGFVGSNLTSYLQKKNYSVSGLSRNKTSVFETMEEVLLWDELEAIKDNDFNVFIHLAGKAHDLKNSSHDEEYHEVNCRLTMKFFDLFLQS